MRYWTRSLTARLITNFLAISAVGLVATTIVAFVIMRAALTQSIYDRLEAVATLKEVELNRWVNDLRDEVVSLGTASQLQQSVDLLDSVRKDDPDYAVAKDQILQFLTAEILSHPSFLEISVLSDTGGTVLVSTITENEGQSRLNEKYYAQGRLDIFVQTVHSTPQNSEKVMIIATPVKSSTGTLIGVIVAQVDLERLDTIILERSGLGSTGETYLVDASNNFVTAARFAGSELLLGVHTQAIDAAVKGLDGFGPYQNYEGTPVLGVYHWVDNRDVALIAELSQQEALAPAQRTAITLLIVGLIVGTLLALGTFLLARQLTRPMLAISQAASQVATGNLDATAPVLTQDEIGALASTFNDMTTQLKQLVGNLEQRVEERTSQLVLTTQQSERRAKNLQAVSEVARAISTEQELENLLPLVAQLVSERFDFYHVGIFMLDENQRYAVLRAANSDGGRRMLADGHRLEIGKVGMVGDVAASGQPRIAEDVGKDAVFFDNPFLPETRSELALPLRVPGQIIGVLDVQSREAQAFASEQVEVLTILADQIAIAIQNARYLQETRKLLTEAQSAVGGTVKEYWQAMQAPKQSLGYEISGSIIKPLERPLDEATLKRITDRSEPEIVELPGGISALAIPLRIRDQVVGVINFRLANSKQWGSDELDIIKAVADRLSLALENATLMQATQRRAAKEQAIGEISARIVASVNMRNVLQTAVEELGRALPGSEVQIDFQSNGQSESRE